MRFGLILLAAVLLPLQLLLAATPQETFIDHMGQQAISVLADKSMTLDGRHAAFAKLFNQNFDLKTIGRFVLGRHWREASDDQKAQYQQLFEKMVITVYTQRFDNYAGQQFSVHGSTPVDGAASDVLVHSQIVQTEQGAPPVAVDWRVRSEGSQNKVVDVMVEGVSMSLTQRNDFDGVVAQGGMDGLIRDLQARVSGEKPVALPTGQTK